MKKRSFICLFILLSIMQLIPLYSYSMPQYLEIYNNDKFAKQENKNKCSTCHINPNGGGPRNEFGQAFDKNGRKITNELRQQFPELFDLFKVLKPKIKRIKPKKVTVSEEVHLVIKGKNFEEDIVLEVDGVDINNLASTQIKIINTKKIELSTTFEEAGKHTIQVINTIGQGSNIVKIKVNNI